MQHEMTLTWQVLSGSVFSSLKTTWVLGTSKEMKKPVKIVLKLFHVDLKFHHPSMYLIIAVSVGIKGKWYTWALKLGH